MMRFQIAPPLSAMIRVLFDGIRRRARVPGWLDLLLCFTTLGSSSCVAQLVSVDRGADDASSVELVSLQSRDVYLPTQGRTRFTVPTGPYLVQLRTGAGTVYYAEFEYLDSESTASRVLKPPKFRRFGLGSRTGGIHIVCEAIALATIFVLERFGLPPRTVRDRLSFGDLDEATHDTNSCRRAMEQGLIQRFADTFENPSVGNVKVSIRRTTASVYQFALPDAGSFIEQGTIHILVSNERALIQCGQSVSNEAEFCDSDGSTLGDPAKSLAENSENVVVYTVSAAMNQTTDVDQNQRDQALGKTLNNRLEAIEIDTKSRIERLKPITRGETGFQFRFQSSANSYYPIADVSSVIQNTNTKVLHVLTELDLIGLRNYYSEKVAAVVLPEGLYIKTQSALELFSGLLNALKKMRSISNDLSVTLSFTTTPEDATGARLTVNIEPNDAPTLFSQNGTHRIYRGTYPYTVAKSRFQSYSGKLDLVDDPGSNVSCHMFYVDDHQNESWCSQQ